MFYRLLASQGAPEGTLGGSLGAPGGFILGVILDSGAGWASEVPQGLQNYHGGAEFGTFVG